MRFPLLQEGYFIRRDNRFRTTVRVEGQETPAHIANSGRLKELLVPGRRVWLAPVDRAGRVTLYDLVLVEHDGVMVSVDARIPNRLFEELVRSGPWRGRRYERVEREVAREESRLDFRLSGPGGVCWVETKSANLVEDGLALFPDAPTKRGLRHVLELMRAVQAGEGAAVVFVVQRSDANYFAPHREADPSFADVLRQARTKGVEVLAYRCRVTREAMKISEQIPVVGLD
ncbi:MAG: hypothetical protein A2Y73_07515 [Chloroflexi bacterium RBG_13_56_8]|nr:MAG: hypothetical protein A2Y73_07515 [Chloroflexi bacterium RBG_13_56_8]